MADGIVILRTYANEYEADLARAILEAHEIPALVLRDDAGGMYPSLTFIHGVRLAVRREDARDALELLDAAASTPDEEAADLEANDGLDDDDLESDDWDEDSDEEGEEGEEGEEWKR
ncbi:MAG TPA: hypothetical protein VFW98_00215 [Gemmatimonadaceae bacterium]|nr:hypothetical protein [Gemmatimonadaceae bacterium]